MAYSNDKKVLFFTNVSNKQPNNNLASRFNKVTPTYSWVLYSYWWSHNDGRTQRHISHTLDNVSTSVVSTVDTCDTTLTEGCLSSSPILCASKPAAKNKWNEIWNNQNVYRDFALSKSKCILSDKKGRENLSFLKIYQIKYHNVSIKNPYE